MSKTYDIVIQGAGPVGLACAGWLLQSNPHLHLLFLDKNPSDTQKISNIDQRGIAISEGSKLLLETLLAWPQNSPAIHQVNISQKSAFGRATMTRNEIGQDALGYVVRYSDIYLSLRHSLERAKVNYKNFDWQFNAEIKNIYPHMSLETCLIHAEGGLFQEQIANDQHHDYAQTALVGWIEAPDAPKNQAWERFTSEGPLALLPHHKGPGHLNMVWCAKPHTNLFRMGLPAIELMAELQKAIGSRIGKITQIHDLRTYPLGLNVRTQIVKDNEVWIGNAAQTLHPVAGQGLNLGLRDAATLSGCLTPLVNEPKELRQVSLNLALQKYATLRQSDRKTTIGMTDFMARVFATNLKPVVFFRGIALSSLEWLPPIKKALARQMMFGQR